MYLTTTKSRVSSSTVGAFQSYSTLLETFDVKLPKGIADKLAEATKRQQHVQAILGEVFDGTAEQTTIDNLANCKGTSGDLITTALRRELGSKGRPTVIALCDMARVKIGKELVASMQAHGDKWITDTFRPHVTKAVETITNAIPQGIELDLRVSKVNVDFLLTQEKTSQAWATLQAVYETARALRSYGIIPNTLKRDDYYEYLGAADANEENEERTRQWLHANNITAFATAIQQGLQPGLYTETETNQKETVAA